MTTIQFEKTPKQNKVTTKKSFKELLGNCVQNSRLVVQLRDGRHIVCSPRHVGSIHNKGFLLHGGRDSIILFRELKDIIITDNWPDIEWSC